MVSICTIARGRERHLRNLLLGLTQQTILAKELVIAYMQPDPYPDLPPAPFPVRQVPINGTRVPLAMARNAAATAAKSDTLIFLDVDCIPLPDLVASYLATIAPDRCLMGETRYLARSDRSEELSFEDLWQRAEHHPARQFGPETVRLWETTEFWSLSFAMMADAFWKTGGFDPLFEGYGGEDTDFAMSLASSGVDLYWVPEARAVHQWHAVQIPALDHFEDIVRNANLFFAKHGSWCMDYWLGQFERQGLIRRTGGSVEILRSPSADERQAAVCDGSVRFS